MVHQLLHEVADPVRDYLSGSDSKSVKSWFLCSTMAVAQGFLVLTNINNRFSIVVLILFNALIVMYIANDQNLREGILGYATFSMLLFDICGAIIIVMLHRSYKHFFMS